MSFLDTLLDSEVPAAPVVTPALWQKQGGVTNFTRLYGQRFARQLLESVAYRTWLEERITGKRLSVQMEIELWHYAYGKPQEQVNVTVSAPTEDLSTLSVSDLQARLKVLSDQLVEAAAVADAIDVAAAQVA